MLSFYTFCSFSGEYAYARWTLQKLIRIYESEDGYNEDAFPLEFNGREDTPMSLPDVIDTLHNLMDIAFKAVMGVEEYDEDDEDYQAAKKLFINEDGMPYGAVVYGLFLNLYYANVFKVHPSLNYGERANIENVTIHGLHHKVYIILKFAESSNLKFCALTRTPGTMSLKLFDAFLRVKSFGKLLKFKCSEHVPRTRSGNTFREHI